MKTIWLILFILSTCISYSQETLPEIKYYGTLAPLYINHSPSAKAEAMGKGLVANNNGDYGSYYNPALTSLSEGLNTNFSYIEVGGIKPSLSYYGASYSGKKLGSIGVTAYYFTKPQNRLYAYDEKYKGGYYDAIYTVNYSREIVKDFYAGVNLGIFHYSNYFYSFSDFDTPVIDDGATLDLGLLKKFELPTVATKQTIRLGTALYNITGSKVTNGYESEIYKDPLPVIFRFGISHEIALTNIREVEFSFFSHAEYENMLNSKYDIVYKLGEEFSINNIFHFRVGYYYSEVTDEYYYTGVSGYQSEFTGGIGLSLPINKILKMKNPLILKIDFSSIAPPDERKYFFYNIAGGDNTENHNFKTIGLSINYIP